MEQPVPNEIEERPTVGHQLAQTSDDGPEHGAAHTKHNTTEVQDLGWHADPHHLPEPLIGELSNEQLWTLTRRFNKQLFHVKALDEPPVNGLDLEIAKQEVYTPDKFRAHLERLYMTVVVGAVNVWKHIVRIRSWREWRRTAIFCAGYAAAWTFDCLLASLFTLLAILVLFPTSRALMFPHAPPALIDGQTGHVKKPMANVLGSDSMTGAPETYPDEAIEQEAHSFVNSIIELAIGMASGQSPEDIANAKDKTGGGLAAVEHDKTKKPVSDAVWEEALPGLHAIAGIADTYERFGNALSPTYPFPKLQPRITVVSALVPLIVGSWFLSAHMAFKGTGFATGILLFGDPVIRRTIAFLDQAYPKWAKYTELRSTILRGVPSNAQLTLTLLRIGERNHSPLPPPPDSNSPLPMDPHPTAGEGLDQVLNTDPQEINAAIQPDPEAKEEADSDLRERTKSKTSSRIMAFFKHIARGGVHAVRDADRAGAHAGIKSARYRAGVVRTGKPAPSGPVKFPARYDGKKGYAYISTGTGGNGEAVIGWVGGNTKDIEHGPGPLPENQSKTKWVMPLEDIHEIQKIGGLGWKSKIAAGWATDGVVMDGVILRGGTGREYHLTAMSGRDQLFNRLVAVGDHIWESW